MARFKRRRTLCWSDVRVGIQSSRYWATEWLVHGASHRCSYCQLLYGCYLTSKSRSWIIRNPKLRPVTTKTNAFTYFSNDEEYSVLLTVAHPQIRLGKSSSTLKIDRCAYYLTTAAPKTAKCVTNEFPLGWSQMSVIRSRNFCSAKVLLFKACIGSFM